MGKTRFKIKFGNRTFRYLSQRGRTSRADKMNLSTWLQEPTAAAKKIFKKYCNRKRRQFLKKLIKI